MVKDFAMLGGGTSVSLAHWVPSGGTAGALHGLKWVGGWGGGGNNDKVCGRFGKKKKHT